MDKATLIERLESYDMRETEASPGFRNTITNIYLLTQVISTGDYIPKDVETLQTQYRLLADHYSAIDFKELEQHKEEPAVQQLFQTRRLIIGLGFTIWGFVEGRRDRKPEQGYQEVIEALELITDLDRNSHYRNRVKLLKGSI